MQKLRYIICTNPRTGSTLLAETLMSTGLCGTNVREHFNAQRFGHIHRTVTDIPAYIERTFAEHETASGASGLKIHWDQLTYLKHVWHRIAGVPIDEAFILQQFPPHTRHIYLYRRNKLDQAISYYIAIKTVQWSSRQVTGRTVRPSMWSSLAILYYVRMFERNDVAWLQYFKRYNIAPYHVVYEDLQAAPDAVTRDVCNFLGVIVPRDIQLSTSLEKQANDLSRQLSDHYHAMPSWHRTVAWYPYLVYRWVRTMVKYLYYRV